MATPFRHRNFTLLWTAGLISITGDWMLLVAVPVTVLGLTGSSAATAAAFAAALLPRVVAAPVAGVLVDRWDRRHALIGACLVQALLVLPLMTVDRAGDLWIVVATTFGTGCVAQVLTTAENALLPTLVEDGERTRANSLNVLNNNLARLIGPAIGGVLTASAGLKAVAALDAATFLAAAGLVVLVRIRRQPNTGGTAAARFWDDLRSGLAVVRNVHAVRVMFVFLAIVFFGEGVMGTMIVVFVERALDGGPRDLGWLVAAQAIGGIAGGLLGGVIGDRVPPRLLTGLGAIGLGVGDLAIFNYPHWYQGVWPALVLMAAVGVPAALSNAGLMTMLQTAVDDRMRGRVFGAALTVMALVALCGTATCALLGDRLGPVTLLNIQGIGMIVGGLYVLRALRSAISGVTPATQRTSATAGRTA
jgi:predicted MFS family arabinose efflux permease